MRQRMLIEPKMTASFRSVSGYFYNNSLSCINSVDETENF